MGVSGLCLYQVHEPFGKQAAEIMQKFDHEIYGIAGHSLGDTLAAAATVLVVSNGLFPSRIIRILPEHDDPEVQLMRRKQDIEKRGFKVNEALLKARTLIVLNKAWAVESTKSTCVRGLTLALANACGWKPPGWASRKKRRRQRHWKRSTFRLSDC